MKRFQLSRALNIRFLKLCVLVITKTKASEKWYASILFVSKFTQFKLTQLLIKKYPLRLIRAYDINAMLDLLTRTGRSFDIPYETQNLEIIKQPEGILIGALHLPLSKIMLRILKDQHLDMQTAIAANPTKDMHMGIWGRSERIPILLKNPSVLVKVRKKLALQQKVGLMIDQQIKGELSPTIFHFCRLTGSKIIFFFPEFQCNALIQTRFVELPFPACENEDQIQQNMAFLEHQRELIWKRYRETKEHTQRKVL